MPSSLKGRFGSLQINLQRSSDRNPKAVLGEESDKQILIHMKEQKAEKRQATFPKKIRVFPCPTHIGT